MSFTECFLGDIVDLNYGKGLSEGKRANGDVNVYGSGGIIGTHNEALVEGPGIIIGRKGNVGSVYYEKNNFFPIDTVYYVSKKRDDDDLRFLYYWFLTLPLDRMNSDAAVPGLNREAAYRVKTKIPDPPIQKKIVNTLSAYDDLIENNFRRIELLEKSAQLLYKEWFVRFRFPGFEHTKFVNGIPEGWEVKLLGELVTLNYGKSLRADKRENGRIPVYGSSGFVGTHNEALAKGPGIVIGRKGNVGSVFWTSKDYFAIDTVYYVDENQSDLFLYYVLKNSNFQSSHGAVPGLNREYAYSKKVILPNDKIKRSFIDIVDPYHKQIDTLSDYNKKLSLARDLLLPKLMKD